MKETTNMKKKDYSEMSCAEFTVATHTDENLSLEDIEEGWTIWTEDIAYVEVVDIHPKEENNMACKCAKFDEDNGWICDVSGDRCVFFIPNSKACAEMYGEGPDVEYPERDED